MQASVVEAYRVREKKEKNSKFCKPKNDSNACKPCDECKPPKKNKSKKLTINQIKNNAGDHCCACCSLILQYFTQLIKYIFCDPKVNFCCLTEICCKMAEVSCCLGRDALDLIKHLLRCIWC